LRDNSVISTETFNYDAAGNVTSAPDSSFQYDTNNRLISFNGNAVSYDLDGNKILRESDGTKTLTYYHGGSGIVGFEYNGTDYYFRKNLQGDVIAIVDKDAQTVARYSYDAWGVCTVTVLGKNSLAFVAD